jgi:hypothetical protein
VTLRKGKNQEEPNVFSHFLHFYHNPNSKEGGLSERGVGEALSFLNRRVGTS